MMTDTQNDNNLPDSSDADRWITPSVFQVGDRYYEITPELTVRELTPEEVQRAKHLGKSK